MADLAGDGIHRKMLRLAEAGYLMAIGQHHDFMKLTIV